MSFTLHFLTVWVTRWILFTFHNLRFISNKNMISFLNKISQLDSIRDVTLLSNFGGILFSSQPGKLETVNQRAALWSDVIEKMAKPMTARLLFEKGVYYLHHTNIGYLIIGMADNLKVEKVTTACVNVETKLSDHTLCRKVLLKMLSTSNDLLKPQLVKELAPFANQEVAETLIALLQKQSGFAQAVRGKLLLFICQTLGYCASRDAIEPLHNILKISGEDKSIPWSGISAAIELSLKQLETAPVLANTQRKTTAPELKTVNSTPGTAAHPSPVSSEKKKKRNLPQEGKIQTLLDESRKSEALALIMQLIESSVQQKDFIQAEKFRDWLMQIDSMAIAEIIRAAEIIEDGKNASINTEDFATWNDLVEFLTPDEFSSLYHAMDRKSYKSGEMIVSQGEYHSSLFFINSGNVRLYAISQGVDVPLKELGPGEIMGAETFFEVSVWTINAKSLGAEVSILSHKRLEALGHSHPALESKLLDFSSRFLSMNSIFKKTRRTRRQHDRKKISGQTNIILINKEGKETGNRAKGDLLDISKGGISFALRFSKKNKAIGLLRQKIRIAIPTSNPTIPFYHDGTVVAVRCQDFVGNEYSLHIEFDKLLDSSKIQTAIAQNR